MSKRTTITTLASYYGLPVEDVRRVAMAEGINDDNYNITGETKRRIHAKLESLQQKQSKGTSGIPTKAKGGELDALKRELSRRNERIRSLEDEVVVKDSQIRELSDESSSYRSQVKRLREEAFAREAQVRDALALRNRMAELETTNAELEGRVQALREQNESLSRKLSNEKLVAKQEAQQYERDRASFKVQLESDRAAIEHAYRDLNAVAVESAQKDMECANLSSWLSDALDEAYQLKVSAASVTTLRCWMCQQNQSIIANASPAINTARDYLAQLLHRRFEESAAAIFGSWDNPNLQLLSSSRAEALKGLRFGNDEHPNCYESKDAAALYCLKYEMGYGFEYYHAYSCLLYEFGPRYLQQQLPQQPLEIVSLGAGQGLDLWGLMYSLAKQDDALSDIPIRWTGVDMEKWPERIIEQANGISYLYNDIVNYLDNRQRLMPQVLIFPKSICELSPYVISHICEWISDARLTCPFHCIIIVHTDRGSTIEYVHSDASEDRVKANSIINSFKSSGIHNGYRVHSFTSISSQSDFNFDMVDPEHNLWFGDYAKNDGAFAPFAKKGKYRKALNATKLLYVRCKTNINKSYDTDYLLRAFCFPNCETRQCAYYKNCSLYRFPRVKLEKMTFQIVGLERP